MEKILIHKMLEQKFKDEDGFCKISEDTFIVKSSFHKLRNDKLYYNGELIHDKWIIHYELLAPYNAELKYKIYYVQDKGKDNIRRYKYYNSLHQEITKNEWDNIINEYEEKYIGKNIT